MNAAIQGLRRKLTPKTRRSWQARSPSAWLFALVAGIALAPVTGGASLIVSGIGGAAIIGGAVTWGVMQVKINSQFDEIAEDQKDQRR